MRSLVAVFLFAVALPCGAFTACGVNGVPLVVLGGSPFMGFAPPEPSASQAVAITVGMINYSPWGAAAVVQGNAINVTLNASYLGFATPPALSCSTATVGPLPAGNYVVNLFLVDPGYPARAPSQVATGALAVAPELNYQGLWWVPNGAESGWGISLAHQGDTIVATWFTYAYDASHKSTWMVMSAQKTGINTYTGQLYGTLGPPFNATPFNPSGVSAFAAGFGTLTFTDANNGVFTASTPVLILTEPVVIKQTKAITRYAFGPLPTCTFGGQPNLSLATNYQDLWWAAPAGSESGWGLSIAHQGDTIVATWYTYDLDDSSMWFLMAAQKTAPGTYAGTLYRTTGPAFYIEPFDPAKVTATPTGSATLTFTDGNSATFAYTVSTVSGTVIQSKKITRFVFVEPGTVCH